MSGGAGAIRVLHVDDDPDVADLAATYLEREAEAITVETTANVDRAVERVSREAFDCVVSDYDMPDRNGIEFLEAVRSIDPTLPFILYTGKGSEEIASEAISAGVSDYLQKGSGPEQYELLANRIVNAVEGVRAKRRASKQARILRVLRDANHALVRSTSRTDIETEITHILAAADPYALAWIGAYDPDADCLRPSTVAGTAADAVGSLELADSKAGLVQRALRTDDIATAAAPAPGLKVWPAERAVAYEAAALVPLVYQGERYGLLGLYANRADWFDDDERGMLAELADDVAQALDTAATHRVLRRHQTAVEAVPVGVFILDADATVELANDTAGAIFDVDSDAVVGQPFGQFVEAGVVEEGLVDWYLDSVRAMLSAESEREEARYETTVHPSDGDPRPIEVHLTLRPFNTEFRGTVGIIRDIAEGTDG